VLVTDAGLIDKDRRAAARLDKEILRLEEGQNASAGKSCPTPALSTSPNRRMIDKERANSGDAERHCCSSVKQRTHLSPPLGRERPTFQSAAFSDPGFQANPIRRGQPMPI